MITNENQNSLDKIENSIRLIIYELFYHLIGKDLFDRFVYIILILIETFQVVFWLFTADVYI